MPMSGTERVNLTCAWENPTDETIRWGEDTGDETNVLVADGDELLPEFGVLAGGVGVSFAPNPVVNPDAIDGVLT